MLNIGYFYILLKDNEGICEILIFYYFSKTIFRALLIFAHFCCSEINCALILMVLTLFKMGFFGAAHEWEWGQKGPLSKICHTYPTMMKRGTVIPYPKKIPKIYESCDTPLEFC